MIFQFIHQHRSSFSVERMCNVLNVSVSGYYAFRKRKRSKREIDNEQLLVDIRVTFHAHRKRYGSPRITQWLRKEKGWSCSKNRVARLMKHHEIRATTHRRYRVTTDSNHQHPVADNRLNQNFLVECSNQVWVSDITYIPTQEGWLYLATILDLFSRKVVGWATSHSLSHDLVCMALQRAMQNRKAGPGLILHSDRGRQYVSFEFQNILTKHGFLPSMSRKGNCYDNACAESFFKTLKMELVYHERYQTRQEAHSSLFEYIEHFYNRIRLHSTLGYLSPEQFERRACLVAS